MEAVDLWLQVDLSCNAVTRRLALPTSSLAHPVPHARLDLGEPGRNEQGYWSAPAERAMLQCLHEDHSELRREGD